MPKWLKACLWITGVVLYFNVGYLFAYSFDSTASQTTLSNFVYKTVDFMGVIGKHPEGVFKNRQDYFAVYAIDSLAWPVILVVSWAANFIVLFWNVFVWLVTGGFWKWQKLIH